MLTLMRLGITGQLAKSVCSTDAGVDDRDRPLHAAQRQPLARERRAQGVDAAGMLVAELKFRRIIGYCDLAKLVVAMERHADRAKSAPADPLSPLTLSRQKPLLSDSQFTSWPPPTIHDDPAILRERPRRGAWPSAPPARKCHLVLKRTGRPLLGLDLVNGLTN